VGVPDEEPLSRGRRRLRLDGHGPDDDPRPGAASHLPPLRAALQGHWDEDLTMRIIRVFPRRTNATPDDLLAFVGLPFFPGLLPAADEVHVSVTFTWDVADAFRLRDAWARYYPVVKIGGPALNTGLDVLPFEPGVYLKEGYTITTRGCPNRCSFCLVPEREGPLRCLPIRPGRIVLDNNLLAAPRGHIERVLDMLARQPGKRIFSGGLEAARLEEWFVQAITAIRFCRVFLAYDRPSQAKIVAEAISLVRYYGHRHDKIGCYLLCGYEGDTLADAARRRRQIIDWGGTPYPMYYQPPDGDGKIPDEWHDFIGASWIRPGAVKDQRCGYLHNLIAGADAS
jgi:hypothetical protein